MERRSRSNRHALIGARGRGDVPIPAFPCGNGSALGMGIVGEVRVSRSQEGTFPTPMPPPGIQGVSSLSHDPSVPLLRRGCTSKEVHPRAGSRGAGTARCPPPRLTSPCIMELAPSPTLGRVRIALTTLPPPARDIHGPPRGWSQNGLSLIAVQSKGRSPLSQQVSQEGGQVARY